MERITEVTFPGKRKLDLKISHKLCTRALLTTCSKEDICKEFPTFTNAEQECLHQLFNKVVTQLHEHIEGDFEALCLATQVGMALDAAERLVEEQSLDPLLSSETDIGDIACCRSTMKSNEIHHLMGMLEKAEEVKRVASARIELLKKGRRDSKVQQVPLRS